MKTVHLEKKDVEGSLKEFRVGRSLILKRILESVIESSDIYNKFLILSRIFCRLKSADSILEKIERKGLEIKDVNEIPVKLPDILGFRIITSNIDELYSIDKILTDDFKVIKKIDKIKKSGEDGEREINYELIYTFGDTSYPFEIQLRTFFQHLFSIPTFHLFHKQAPEKRVKYHDDLIKLSNSLQEVETNTIRFIESPEKAIEYNYDLRILPILNKVHIVVIEPGERFSNHIILDLSGDFERDNYLIVNKKIELYETYPNCAIVECSCMEFSTYILNEPHVNVPVSNWNKI
jgi:ppGpp synthetase/RelA/SpoT-type nucleotidyltranferase